MVRGTAWLSPLKQAAVRIVLSPRRRSRRCGRWPEKPSAAVRLRTASPDGCSRCLSTRAAPLIGAVTLALLFGLYSLIFGVSEIVLGVQMRRTGRTVQAILHDAA